MVRLRVAVRAAAGGWLYGGAARGGAPGGCGLMRSVRIVRSARRVVAAGRERRKAAQQRASGMRCNKVLAGQRFGLPCHTVHGPPLAECWHSADMATPTVRHTESKISKAVYHKLNQICPREVERLKRNPRQVLRRACSLHGEGALTSCRPTPPLTISAGPPGQSGCEAPRRCCSKPSHHVYAVGIIRMHCRAVQ